mgnify:CR=1 FL=1
MCIVAYPLNADCDLTSFFLEDHGDVVVKVVDERYMQRDNIAHIQFVDNNMWGQEAESKAV